jgi:hypothetical protein
MMRTIVAFSFAVAVLLAVPSANAAHLIQSGFNTLEDDDFESQVIDNNGNGLIDVGDRFLGVFRVQRLNGDVKGAGDATITAVFYLEAIELVDNGGGGIDQIFFGAVQDDGDLDGSGSGNDAIDEWADLSPSMPTLMSNNTLAILFEHPDLAGTDNDVDDDGAGGAEIFTSLDTFDDSFPGASKLLEVGFNAGDANSDGVTDDGEFWVTIGEDGIDNPALIAAFLANPLLDDPSNAINVNLTHNYTGIEFLKHSAVFGPFAAAAQLQATGTFVPLGAQPPGDWGLSTDTDLVLFAVPEPTSLVLFSLVSGLGLVVGARRRRV